MRERMFQDDDIDHATILRDIDDAAGLVGVEPWPTPVDGLLRKGNRTRRKPELRRMRRPTHDD